MKRKKSKWIPVNERLPENDREVAVTVSGKRELDDFVSSDYQINGEWQRWNGVIAWRPLPKPFKKKKRGDAMKTWFRNTIDRRPLYSGGEYSFNVETDCISGKIEFAVSTPFKGTRRFDDFEKAKKYYLSLGYLKN